MSTTIYRIDLFLGRRMQPDEDPEYAIAKAIEATSEQYDKSFVSFQYSPLLREVTLIVQPLEDLFQSDLSDEDWTPFEPDLGFPPALPDPNSYIPQYAGIPDSCGGHIAA